MALTPPLTLILQPGNGSNGFCLFRFHSFHPYLPGQVRRPLCISSPDEDRDADEQQSFSAEIARLGSPGESLCTFSSSSERLHFEQNDVQQWLFWLPGFPGLPIKEEFIILPADAVSKSFTWEGWGTSLCWWANFAGGLQLDDKGRLLDLLFDLKKGLGLNVVRYNIGGGADPALNEYLRPFGHVPGLKPGSNSSYNWYADSRQQSILLGARDRGANVFEAFSNSPPHWMTLSGSVTGNTRWGQDNLNPDYDEAFVDYLTEVVKYYKEHRGLHFDYLAPFNEPVEGWWNINRKKKTAQEGCNFTVSSIRRLIPKLKKALVKKKLKTRLSAFDAWSQNTVRVLLGMDEDALSAIDQINVHTYVFITSREDYAKRRQVREACDSIGRHIALDLNELQASAWCYWQALEMPGSLWGLLQTSFTYDTHPINLTISKQYYVLMQFSKWIRPGFQIFPVDKFAEHLVISASFAAKVVVLVFINESTALRDFSYDVSVIAPWMNTQGKMEATLFRTSVTENHESLPSLVFDFPSVMIRVSSRSVTTMVISEGVS
ncbi:hypothetical protein GOP47_0017507 [Adiantum capillus-veneris]|uniref:Endo-beta-1,6-galactanase-like domain-containing protein n=1 Tax=Adiantum capillus-veneris TaxID=13818 RepID=A0A9D4UFI1_ADICA|nr:hypothetical protein GOP47_0017507 [Adiantum capillus-veneris]